MPRRIRTFQLEDEPELLHIVDTGYDDVFVVINENAYDMLDLNPEIYKAVDIKEVYGIDLNKKGE